MQTQTLEKYKPFVLTPDTVRNVFAVGVCDEWRYCEPYMFSQIEETGNGLKFSNLQLSISVIS